MLSQGNTDVQHIFLAGQQGGGQPLGRQRAQCQVLERVSLTLYIHVNLNHHQHCLVMWWFFCLACLQDTMDGGSGKDSDDQARGQKRKADTVDEVRMPAASSE